MSDKQRRASDVPLPPDLDAKVRELVKASTINAAARALNIDKATLYRILGGGPVTKGTAAVIALRLQEARS